MTAVSASSITKCYFDCWKKHFDCIAISFLPSNLNDVKIERGVCMMLKDLTKTEENVITMEVFVSVIMSNFNHGYGMYSQ